MQPMVDNIIYYKFLVNDQQYFRDIIAMQTLEWVWATLNLKSVNGCAGICPT